MLGLRNVTASHGGMHAIVPTHYPTFSSVHEISITALISVTICMTKGQRVSVRSEII